mmetsp:Transcript_1725/g.4859  ORF Transcript_1725/g.4859 Transcript_1725/m.4859 type:complete len:298 (+) Transcript_1725:468-1361(+)
MPPHAYTSRRGVPSMLGGIFELASITHLELVSHAYLAWPTSSSLAALACTSASCSAMKVAMASRRLRSAMPSIRTARRPAFAALPIATVATGTPRGICTIESSESFPERIEVFTGTPMTGSGVSAATIPGRWAAPPAPAMMVCKPRPLAACAYSNILCGVRCAETIVSSYGTPNWSRTSAAAFIVGRSESEPMMMPTRGAGLAAVGSPEREASSPLTSPLVGAVTFTCPILRPFFGGLLPYQCTLADGIVSERVIGASVVGREPSGAPRMLSIAALGTFMLVDPSGRSSTQRKCCSN